MTVLTILNTVSGIFCRHDALLEYLVTNYLLYILDSNQSFLKLDHEINHHCLFCSLSNSFIEINKPIPTVDQIAEYIIIQQLKAQAVSRQHYSL